MNTFSKSKEKHIHLFKIWELLLPSQSLEVIECVDIVEGVAVECFRYVCCFRALGIFRMILIFSIAIAVVIITIIVKFWVRTSGSDDNVRSWGEGVTMENFWYIPLCFRAPRTLNWDRDWLKCSKSTSEHNWPRQCWLLPTQVFKWKQLQFKSFVHALASKYQCQFWYVESLYTETNTALIQ